MDPINYMINALRGSKTTDDQKRRQQRLPPMEKRKGEYDSYVKNSQLNNTPVKSYDKWLGTSF